MTSDASGARPLVTITAPFYRAADCVDEFVARVSEAAETLPADYEILLVEDGSPDDTWAKIDAACAAHPHVRGVRLSRNFGQQAAILAGFELAKGDLVVLMDCDLEHDPSYIPALFEKCVSGGHDVVYARQDERRRHPLKNASARLFYALLSLISPYDIDPLLQNFSILRRRVVDAYLQSTRYQAAYLQTLHWLGFDQASITVRNRPRFSGKSSYSLTGSLAHALNITIAYSHRLLLLSTYSGVLFSLAAIGGVVVISFRYFVHGVGVEGWTSLMVALMFFSGLILGALGVLGLYLGKVFDQTKQRPRFIIADQRNGAPSTR